MAMELEKPDPVRHSRIWPILGGSKIREEAGA